MQNNIGAKRRVSLKISSRYVGRWIVRPIVGIAIRESMKTEHTLKSVLERIGELERSVEAIAREMARTDENQSERTR